MTQTQSRSLYADAWRRLLKNRLAVLCGIVVVIQSVLAALSPLIAPFDADAQELWIQEQAPGYRHPDVKAEMVLELGAPCDLPHRATRAAERHGLTMHLLRSVRREIRVNVNRGQVSSILVDGRDRASELRVRTGEGAPTWRVPGANGEPGTVITEGRIAEGEPVPAWLERPDAPRRWIALIEEIASIPSEVKLVARRGQVTDLRENGVERDKIVVAGQEVVALVADGKTITHTHWLGTDSKGRDLWSRILYGGWISLLVGLVATVVSLLIGVIYGAISGYFGGRIDTIMMAAVDILYAIPYMFLVILLLVVFGRNIIMLFIALGAVQWLTMARIVRGQVLSLKEKEFIDAARTSGGGTWGIIFRHLIPNTLGIVIVYTTLTVPTVILQEAFLAFIGLNVELNGEAIDSWGALVNLGRQSLGNDGQNWWLLVFPGTALAVMLFSLNFVGDGLRDAFDPKLRGKA